MPSQRWAWFIHSPDPHRKKHACASVHVVFRISANTIPTGQRHERCVPLTATQMCEQPPLSRSVTHGWCEVVFSVMVVIRIAGGLRLENWWSMAILFGEVGAIKEVQRNFIDLWDAQKISSSSTVIDTGRTASKMKSWFNTPMGPCKGLYAIIVSI